MSGCLDVVAKMLVIGLLLVILGLIGLSMLWALLVGLGA